MELTTQRICYITFLSFHHHHHHNTKSCMRTSSGSVHARVCMCVRVCVCNVFRMGLRKELGIWKPRYWMNSGWKLLLSKWYQISFSLPHCIKSKVQLFLSRSLWICLFMCVCGCAHLPVLVNICEIGHF